MIVLRMRLHPFSFSLAHETPSNPESAGAGTKRRRNSSEARITIGAQGGSRIPTSKGHWNLNPACLPVPTPGQIVVVREHTSALYASARARILLERLMLCSVFRRIDATWGGPLLRAYTDVQERVVQHAPGISGTALFWFAK